MRKTAAVVVTYNRKELLAQCMDCLLSQTDAICDILVIDNASTDGTGEMIRVQFSRPEVIYENTGSNLGGAGGFQYGVEKAVRMGYEYIWIMDDDTLPEKRALAELLSADHALNGRWGFLSSTVCWTDGSICRANVQKKTLFRFVGEKDYQAALTPVRMGSFVSLFVKREIVLELGLPIGEYFIWTDDYEFTGRISRKYPCYLVPESRVVHAMKAQGKADLARDSLARLDRYICLYRNDVHCYRQYGAAGWAYILAKDAYTAMKILVHADGCRIRRLNVMLKGFREGLRFRPEIRYPKAGPRRIKEHENRRAGRHGADNLTA